MSRIKPIVLIGLLALAACAEPPVTPLPMERIDGPLASLAEGTTYVLIGHGETLPADLAASVTAAGGTLTYAMGVIGVATATSEDPGFADKASKISGIGNVVLDEMVQWVQPTPTSGEVEANVDEQSHGPTGVGAHETFRLVQWAPDAVNAPAAWAAGYQGAGARVAIVDGGINRNHFDIKPNFDAARSASFVPGQPYFFDTGNFWHGTHVAGIVGAPANDTGTVGIAPKATLIGVKVLHNGSGAFSWVIAGIVYAATPIAENGAGADIINMSLGAGFFRQGRNNSQLAVLISRATQYANQRGVTVIAAAGNSAVDFDHTANLIFVPAQSVGVIAVAATGPVGWAVPGMAFDLDRPASYTNFGQSAIGLAGPGGDFVLPGNALCSKPRLPTGLVTNFCWVFDMVMAPFGAANNGYGWAAGTSMASPAVAGVAALIVGKARSLGIPLSPAGVRTQLERSSDDLGKPGNDDFYGAGRVNAGRAIQ